MGVSASWYHNRKFLYAFRLIAEDIDPILSLKTSIAFAMSLRNVCVLSACWALGVMRVFAILQNIVENAALI